MVCEECEKYKRMAKINIEDLRKYVEQDKELKENLEKIFKAIVKEKVEEPKSWYKYPDKKYTEKDIAEWFEATENMYHLAQHYETQERGIACSVDRAYSKYLIPECRKLLSKLNLYHKEMIEDD